MSPRGCGEETGVRKPFSSPPAGTVSFRSPPQPVDLKRRGDGRSETVFVASCRGCVFSPPPSMDLERRGDGRSETVFAASAGKLPDPTSPHLIWRRGKRSKTFFVVSDRQGIKSSSHGPRNRRGGRHSETVCIVVSKTPWRRSETVPWSFLYFLDHSMTCQQYFMIIPVAVKVPEKGKSFFRPA